MGGVASFQLAPAISEAADAFLQEIRFDESDPGGTVSAASRRLCAGLGALSQVTHSALGGAARAASDVGLAGALLSLLTKLDDQVIDAAAFHRGLTRAEAKAKTRAYLAPTLASIRRGRPETNEARCHLAARLGALLTRLGPETRVDRLFASIARGWEVQTDAVSVLTRHASEVTTSEVERVTRDISGVWLLMIAQVGSVPAETRSLSAEEVAAFEDWGDAIQKADALNDLHKDIADGHWSTYPLRLLFERAPDAYASAREGAPLDPLLARHGVAATCLAPARLASARARHATLPAVVAMLDWIHQHLVARYVSRLRGLGGVTPPHMES